MIQLICSTAFSGAKGVLKEIILNIWTTSSGHKKSFFWTLSPDNYTSNIVSAVQDS